MYKCRELYGSIHTRTGVHTVVDTARLILIGFDVRSIPRVRQMCRWAAEIQIIAAGSERSGAQPAPTACSLVRQYRDWAESKHWH